MPARTTQAPIGTMSPVSSATGMKSAGEICPRVGWFQRIKRLERANAIVLEVEQGLIVELELVALDCRAQVGLELAALLRALVQALLEESVGAAARFLGAIKREVGVAQHCLAVAAVLRRDGDSDAGRWHQLIAVDHQRLGHGIENVARQPVDGVAVVADGLKHDELVAAKPGDEMAARRLLHSASGLDEQRCRRRGGRACR